MHRAMDRTEWTLLVVLAVLWSGAFLFAKVALAELGPLTIVLGRVAIAAALLAPLLLVMGDRLPLTAAAWGAFGVMGLLNNAVPQALIAWGMLHIDSGLASILNATTPVFTVLLAHRVRDERLTARRLCGVLVGVAGVALLVGPAALRGLTAGVVGQLAILGAAASYACAGLYGRRLRALSPLAASAGMLIAATVILLPLAALVERPWRTTPGAVTWSALLALAVLSTAVGYVVYFRVLATAGPTNLLLVTFLMPVGGVALGATVLGERPRFTSLAGMLVIFAALAVIDGRLLRAVRSVWIFGHFRPGGVVGRSRTGC
jgi:drug/metabolite transporter (DMT)-like permease